MPQISDELTNYFAPLHAEYGIAPEHIAQLVQSYATPSAPAAGQAPGTASGGGGGLYRNANTDAFVTRPQTRHGTTDAQLGINAGSIAAAQYADQQMFGNLYAAGYTPQQVTDLLRSLPTSQLNAITEQGANIENAKYQPDSTFDKIMQGLSLASGIAGISLAGGAALAPALAGAATAAGAGATASGILGAAGSGLVTGAATSALEGQNIGKGALTGAVGGGIGAGAAPITSSLVSDGVNPTLAGALVKGTAGAATGALGAGLTGGNVGQAAELGGISGAASGAIKGSGLLTGNSPLTNALAGTGAGAAIGALRGTLTGQGAGQGAAGGALNAASGAVTGSILSGAGTIFNSGDAGLPTTNPALTEPAAPASESQASNPFTYDSAFDPSNTSFDASQSGGNDFGFDPATLGNIDTGYLNQSIQNNPALGDFNNPLTFQSDGGNGGGSGSSLLGSLAKLLGAGSGNGSVGGITQGGLQQLLGLLTQTGAGIANSSAARGAASTFADQTSFKPYTVNGNGASTSFDGTTATSSLSPQNDMLSKLLTTLAGGAGSSLASGPGQATTDEFNNLQSGSLQAQQRLLGNTQDNEFANGVLGSTAGGYQTQGALNAIGNQTNQNYTTATNLAEQEQQQQLQQLTQSLSGIQSLSQQQLQQLQLALSGGSQASNANRFAYQPALAANSNSNIGNLLTSLGSTPAGPYSSSVLNP